MKNNRLRSKKALRALRNAGYSPSLCRGVGLWESIYITDPEGKERARSTDLKVYLCRANPQEPWSLGSQVNWQIHDTNDRDTGENGTDTLGAVIERWNANG